MGVSGYGKTATLASQIYLTAGVFVTSAWLIELTVARVNWSD